MNAQAAPGAYPRNLNRQIHGLRGFSALAVFVYHVYGMGTLWNFWPASLNPVAPFFAAGKHGVEIFFIISGYLITGSLIRHASAAKFLVDRAIRIYPVFLTIQLIVFAVGPVIHYKWLSGISPPAWAMAFVENGLFLPGIFDLPLAQLNAWSLSYEAAFYLLAAASYVLARHAGRRPVIAALAVLAAILVVFAPQHARAVFFLPGVAIYFLSRRAPLDLPPWLRAFSVPALIATLAVLTVAETVEGLIYAAAITGFVFFLCVVEGRCLLSALLRTRFLQYLGTISYSFYLWSPVVTFPMKLVIQRYLHGRLDDRGIVALFATIGFAASVVVAHASYRVLEDAAGRWLHRRAATQPIAVGVV
ncbi:MAG TPA: acyltransferase [Alphaproteobacteria bacterium]|jgi:peptidoglycan/LPS O-acetylase OafA/YrhL|nr:acyltransferase [Alphaproteobacteria bacterium]